MIQGVPMPLLEHLELLFELGSVLATAGLDLLEDFRFRLQCPKLKNFRFKYIPVLLSSPFLQDLQELDIEGVEFSIQELCALAHATPQLKTLCLDSVILNNFDRAGQHGNFPRLESLELFGKCDYEMTLSCFYAPVLSCFV